MEYSVENDVNNHVLYQSVCQNFSLRKKLGKKVAFFENARIRRLNILVGICCVNFLLIGLFSCSKQSDEHSRLKEQVVVEVNLTDGVFEELGELNNRAASPFMNDIDPVNRQRNEIPLGDDLFLTAELTPQTNDDIKATNVENRAALAKGDKRAAQEITPIGNNVRYKLLVYTSTGTFVTHRDYVRSQEASTAPLLLDGGVTYTFVAYSINSSATGVAGLPNVTVTGAQTLANTSVAITGNQDFMYFRHEVQLAANTTNRLDIILRHRMSQITTIIDASAIGYNISVANSSFNRHNPTASVPLATGLPNRTGTAGTTAVSFPSLGAQVVTSTPTIINAATNSLTSYTISSLTIGSINRTNLTPFTTLTVTPGVKYNLRLTITPDDIHLVTGNQYAARINGAIWMRHNLGADIGVDPDQNPSVMALHGNYYQWGRAASVANASTGSGAITPWNGATNQPANSWNSGTEANPVKTNNDPCPAGWRVPSRPEKDALVAATTTSNIGNWNNSATNFSAAKVFRSRRNANVQLTFPINGSRYFEAGTLWERGLTGFYWWSHKLSATTAERWRLRQNEIEDGTNTTDWASGIRCILD